MSLIDGAFLLQYQLSGTPYLLTLSPRLLSPNLDWTVCCNVYLYRSYTPSVCPVPMIYSKMKSRRDL